MKKTLLLFLALCLLLLHLSGCGVHEVRGSSVPSVVTTIFPIYDWTRNLIGENPGNLRLTLLLDKGTDLHSYQPTVKDMTAISACDLFIYVGGESDDWVAGALAEASNQNMVVLNLMEVLGDAAKKEETAEGMQGGAEDGDEYDEHVWLSLKNARACCVAIFDALAALDPEHYTNYWANAGTYFSGFTALDAAYAEAVEAAAHDTLVFADRFPFRYLLDDYGLDYYAAFPGCEAETEASFETIAFLAGKMDELDLPAVLTTESPIPRLAETVVESTAKKDAKILALDSMQSATAADIESHASYLSLMAANLDVLKEALG